MTSSFPTGTWTLPNSAPCIAMTSSRMVWMAPRRGSAQAGAGSFRLSIAPPRVLGITPDNSIERALTGGILGSRLRQVSHQFGHSSAENPAFSEHPAGTSGGRRNPIALAEVSSGASCHRGANRPGLRELDGRDRPFAIVASNRNPQAVEFVEPDALHRPGLSIGEDDCLANNLGLGLLELAKDRIRADFR